MERMGLEQKSHIWHIVHGFESGSVQYKRFSSRIAEITAYRFCSGGSPTFHTHSRVAWKDGLPKRENPLLLFSKLGKTLPLLFQDDQALRHNIEKSKSI